MTGRFLDHPRKKVVREIWDTPILRHIRDKWEANYFYCGLPGPEAIDIVLWRDMIRRIIAFEQLCEGSYSRKNIAQLNRNLTVLQIPHKVYSGNMEEVIIDGIDLDGLTFEIDELVTLFNLDFCDHISSTISTYHGKELLRFEALREIISLQRRIYRITSSNKFILLITARDALHYNVINPFLANKDLPLEIRTFVDNVVDSRGIEQDQYGLVYDSSLLKTFIFSCLRDYLRGQAVKSVFLPPVIYSGATEQSPMIHFVVICSMEDMETAQVTDDQIAEDFLRMKIIRVTDNNIEAANIDPEADTLVNDAISFIEDFKGI